MSNLDDKLRVWSQAPSLTENDRIERTERMVKAALSRSADPRVVDARVFAKGSVKARTNIRNGSDIDLAVIPKNVFFTEYPEGKGDKDFGNSGVAYTFSDFRLGVLNARQEGFGYSEVSEGNKSLKIRGTFSGSRIDADVVPAFEHRRYTNPSNPDYYLEGIEFIPQTGGRVINWPHHNYDNTINKQSNTAKRYRKVVRILKNVRNQLEDAGIDAGKNIASFLIESLAWNAPNNLYGNWSLSEDVFSVLDHLIHHTGDLQLCGEWGEVNELKYLFRQPQKWTREQANDYLRATKAYLESI